MDRESKRFRDRLRFHRPARRTRRPGWVWLVTVVTGVVLGELIQVWVAPWVGVAWPGHVGWVPLANTAYARAQGLMGRRMVGAGLLLVWRRPGRYAFWMAHMDRPRARYRHCSHETMPRGAG